MSSIIVGLGGGLGNRFPPLCSALRLSRIYDRKLYAFWGPQEEVHIGPSDIFGSDLPFTLGVPEGDRPVLWYPRDDEGENLAGPVVVPDPGPDFDIRFHTHRFFAHPNDAITPKYESRDRFMLEVGRCFHKIPLADQVVRRVADFEAEIDFATTLGVHVRRGVKNSIWTDADRGRDWWHIDAYARAIEIIMERRPHLKSLYLATNSEESRDYLRSRFPGVTYSNDRAGDGWATREFQIEAFVEMVVLSRCNTILRQPGTSFSLFAAVAHGAELVTMNSFNGHTNEPDLEWADWR